MNWIKRIEESENINYLPLYNELNEIAENEDKRITIKDETIVELEKDHNYFANKSEKDYKIKVPNLKDWIL